MSPAANSRVLYLATSVGRDPVRRTMSPTVEMPSSTAMACKNFLARSRAAPSTTVLPIPRAPVKIDSRPGAPEPS